MALKFLDATGSGTTANAAAAIEYAADNGAQVISASWGAYATSNPVLDEAIDYAESRDCVFVAAAGNDHDDVANVSPANNPSVVSVGALNPDDTVTSFSNFGKNISMFAPGVDILSLRAARTDLSGDGSEVVGGIYMRASGTSMACPYAAGAAALLRSEHRDWNNKQIIEYLTRTCDDISAKNPQYAGLLGYGKLNALSLCTQSAHPSIAVTGVTVDDSASDFNGQAAPGEKINLIVTLTNQWADAADVDTVLSSTDPLVQIDQAQSHCGAMAQNAQADCDFTLQVSSDAAYGDVIELNLAIDADGVVTNKPVQLSLPWPVENGWPKDARAVSVTPIDLDGDGMKEIVVLSSGDSAQSIDIYRADGSEYGYPWPLTLAAGASSQLSFGDIDGDGKQELIVSQGAGLGPAMVEAIRLDGSIVAGWPFTLPDDTFTAQAMVADIDPSTPGLETIVQAFVYVKGAPGYSDEYHQVVYAIAATGQALPGFPVNLGASYDLTAAPPQAVGDIDGDAIPEIVVSFSGFADGSPLNYLYALDGKGQTKPGWPCRIPSSESIQSVVIGDVNGDGAPEIIAGGASLHIFSGAGQLLNGSWAADYHPGNSLCLADIDGDGKLAMLGMWFVKRWYVDIRICSE